MPHLKLIRFLNRDQVSFSLRVSELGGGGELGAKIELIFSVAAPNSPPPLSLFCLQSRHFPSLFFPVAKQPPYA
jgi:hypothetical protein